jgi:hypothetical protein
VPSFLPKVAESPPLGRRPVNWITGPWAGWVHHLPNTKAPHAGPILVGHDAVDSSLTAEVPSRRSVERPLLPSYVLTLLAVAVVARCQVLIPGWKLRDYEICVRRGQEPAPDTWAQR